MEGLMQSYDLSVLKLLDHAAKYHSDAGIYSFSSKNVKSFRSWAEARHRARALAVGLQGLGVKPGDRVATLAYNTSRHMEVWFGIMGTGAVCHTLNPRLFLDDIDYIANDAGDTFLLADPELADLARQLAPRVPSLRAVIWLDDVIPKTAKAPRFSRELLAEDLIKDASVVLSGGWDWVRVPETAACGLCYTSGTTGRPKGVLYSHRANVLHALAIMLPDSFALSSSSTILNVVPLFHANGWGLPFAAAASGATLVMPGPNLDGASLLRVMSDVGVTMTAGVPTIWMALMQEMERTGRSLPKLKIVGVAGSACPAIVMDFFESRGTQVRHAWGMTECCPIVTIASAKKSVQEAPNNPWAGLRLRQGMPHALCELRVVDENGKEAPMDGKTSGNIQIRGPHVLSQYYKKGVSATDADGWFDTGDVGNLSPEGYMQITDRSKDVIKSGGEWISSIEIENAAVGHPDVAEAAVIAVPHPKWTERPLLLVVPKAGRAVTRDSMLKFLQPLLAKWWLPEDVVSIKEIPHTATGKINKLRLRQLYGGYSFGGDEAPRAKL